MVNLATGGSSFSHDGSHNDPLIAALLAPPNKKLTLIFNIQVGVFIIAVAGISILFTYFVSKLELTIPLWDVKPIDIVDGSTGYSSGRMFSRSLLWSIIPTIFLFISLLFISALIAVNRFFVNTKYFTAESYPIIFAPLILALVLIFINPFPANESSETSLDDWAADRYGIQLSSEVASTENTATEEGLIPQSIGSDVSGNVVYAMKDPKRDNLIFLYHSDGKTELALKGEK